MIKDSIYALWISWVICAIACPIMIPILHKLKFGQKVREDGPESHLKKSGTPTMGGIMILIAIVVTGLIFALKYPRIIPIMLMTVGFGVVGFVDDYLKVVKNKSEGLKVWQKLALQIVMTGILAWVLYHDPEVGSRVLIPMTGTTSNGIMINLGIAFLPFVFFVVLGTDNGVNFTDGLDGLCSCVTIAVTVFFMIASIIEGDEIAPIAGAVIGSLLGFLLYNTYPAKIFMGDTGSLALGGFVASYALVMRYPLFIVIAGGIYLIEVLSVIIQVTYYKISGGKRVFRMAPIHHHFELGGMRETQVVMMFTVITILLGSIALITLL